MTTIQIKDDYAEIYDDVHIPNPHGLKVQLGCGNCYIKGWLNTDKSPLVKRDMFVDLEKPLPFKDNSVDEIIANHVLEHINNFIPLVKEMHRICKRGAKIYIRVPFYAGWGQWNDPTHVRFFSLYTFDYFNPSLYSHECGVSNKSKPMFDIEVKLNYAIGRLSFLNWIINPIINLWQDFYVRFFGFIIPASEIRYELEVLK